jgi:hypothetical protein
LGLQPVTFGGERLESAVHCQRILRVRQPARHTIIDVSTRSKARSRPGGER